MVFITLMMMGIVSVAIGLMPTYQTIGIAAPLILVLLRIIQDLAVGGEWAGASLMAAEHAKEKNRGFAMSVAVTGPPDPLLRRWSWGSLPGCRVTPSSRGRGGRPSCSLPPGEHWGLPPLQGH